jgi:hypothetical protein
MLAFSKARGSHVDMAKNQIVKPGDPCLDQNCKGKLVIVLICDDDTCGGTIHPADGFNIQIPGLLNKIQMDLLSSFLVGHWKEISTSEYKVAFERILETLNPGALQAVKHLQKVM